MDLTTFNSDVATMSSLEIAELTGKEHKNVMADIRKMLDELGILAAQFSAARFDSRNKELPCFNLPKRETSILVSGYNLAMRAKIIDRWQELEAGLLPKTRIEALRQLADSLEREDALKTEVNGLMIKLDAHADYATVKKMEAIFSRKFNWRPLKAKSIELGFKLYKAEDANYESGVNVYHKDVWKSVYDIDIKQHLRMKDGKMI